MLKLTPPMGWNSWNTFAANIDEKLIMESADAMVESGLRDAGYEYLVIDDCWSKKHRENGKLVADPEKFPHGMKFIGDYIHSKGLKFGMYSCAGNLTCGGYPASFEHEFTDAESFAQWGVDFLKYDYCNKPKAIPGEVLYRRMGNALANCGREILFNSCSWGTDKTEEWVRSANVSMWRSTGDIMDAWHSIKHIHQQQLKLQPYNSLGCFNDMDMLVVGMNGKGNVGLGGCSYEEYRTHFSLWAMLNSPLVIGCDIRNMSDETKSILLNRDMIAINQDPAGCQPYLAGTTPWVTDVEYYVWVKQLNNGDVAIGMFNMGDADQNIEVSLFDMGLGVGTGKTLELFDVWNKTTEKVYNELIIKEIKPHDCRVYRAKVVDA